MSEYVTQVRDLMRKAAGNSDGDVALLEEASRIADIHGDVQLGMEVRTKLISAANWSGNYEMVLVAFTWCLAQLDRDESIRLLHERTLLWYYKWVISSLGDYAQVSREQIERGFADMSLRYERAGYGPNALMKCRAYASLALGDIDAFASARAKWLAAPRDSISDCLACETDTAAGQSVSLGDLEEALQTADPIIQGRQRCKEVPCRTFGRLLLPLLKLGHPEQAADLHRRSIRQTLSSREFLWVIGNHCAYLGFVGDFMKGLRIFEVAMSWAMIMRRTADRMEFFENAAVLFEKLAEQSRAPIKLRIPESAPFYDADATYEPAAVARALDQMSAETIAQFNRRNGNDYMTQRHGKFREMVDSIKPAS